MRMNNSRKLEALYDNYERSVTQGEDHTQQEQAEEEDFLKVVFVHLFDRTFFDIFFIYMSSF